MVVSRVNFMSAYRSMSSEKASRGLTDFTDIAIEASYLAGAFPIGALTYVVM